MVLATANQEIGVSYLRVVHHQLGTMFQPFIAMFLRMTRSSYGGTIHNWWEMDRTAPQSCWVTMT